MGDTFAAGHFDGDDSGVAGERVGATKPRGPSGAADETNSQDRAAPVNLEKLAAVVIERFGHQLNDGIELVIKMWSLVWMNGDHSRHTDFETHSTGITPLLSQTAAGRRPGGTPCESQPGGDRRITSQPDQRPTARYDLSTARTGPSHTSRRIRGCVAGRGRRRRVGCGRHGVRDRVGRWPSPARCLHRRRRPRP